MKNNKDPYIEELKKMGVDYITNTPKPAATGQTNVGFYPQLRSIANKPIKFVSSITKNQALEILSNGSCGD